MMFVVLRERESTGNVDLIDTYEDESVAQYQADRLNSYAEMHEADDVTYSVRTEWEFKQMSL